VYHFVATGDSKPELAINDHLVTQHRVLQDAEILNKMIHKG
jgi:hypothetical protein